MEKLSYLATFVSLIYGLAVANVLAHLASLIKRGGLADWYWVHTVWSVFLMLLIPEVRLRWLGVAFGVVFTLNLLAAIPPTPGIRALLPIAGPLGIGGSLAMLAITAAALRWLLLSPAARVEPSGRPSP